MKNALLFLKNLKVRYFIMAQFEHSGVIFNENIILEKLPGALKGSPDILLLNKITNIVWSLKKNISLDDIKRYALTCHKTKHYLNILEDNNINNIQYMYIEKRPFNGVFVAISHTDIDVQNLCSINTYKKLEALFANYTSKKFKNYMTIPKELTKSGPIYLTPREKDCLILSICGLSAKEISCKLKLDLGTIHYHFNNARTKLNTKTIQSTVGKALLLDLLPIEL